MTQDERLLDMLAWLQEANKITLAEVCTRYGISRDSARRDLVKLTTQRGVQRVRGGAILAPVSPMATAYTAKTISDSKLAIGRAAARLVSQGDCILMDTGTTLTAMANSLDKPGTVVTNSVDCLTALASQEGMRVHFLGGEFNPFHRAMLGSTALNQLSQYRVNKVFLGVCALSILGTSTTSEAEAQMKKAMMAQAEQVVLLCDNSKLGQQHMFAVAEIADIDVLITDQTPPDNFLNILHQHDIQLIVTNPNE